MHLNHPETIQSPAPPTWPSLWKNCLPWNWSLGPKRLETAYLRSSMQWQATPVLLPRKSHGQRSLVGSSPWGRYESGMTERLHFHTLEKEMATHSSVLAWRIPGKGEPSGLPSMGSHRVGHDWSNLAAAAAAAWNLQAAITVFPSLFIILTSPHTHRESKTHIAIPVYNGLFIALLGFLPLHINRYLMW